MEIRLRNKLVIVAATCFLVLSILLGQAAAQQAARAADAQGVIDVPGFVLPFSDYASSEARGDFELRRSEPRRSSDGNEAWIERAVAAQRRLYPATMTESVIGGVGVRTFVPRAGIAPENQRRVLLNLHAGGFQENWDAGSQIESLPLATVGRIKVISVNYRMAPAHRFPAASEDVASVYRDLLRSYDARSIAIYGCSAGGVLGPQSVAWIQQAGLPTPAALGIFSGSLTRISGDSLHFTGPLAGVSPPSLDVDALFNATTGGYFSGVSSSNPMMWPAASQEVLARFPPTLLMTGARGAEMSATIQSHLDLVSAGVQARLYLWDGVGHCFMYNPELPESRQAYELAAEFFLSAMR